MFRLSGGLTRNSCGPGSIFSGSRYPMTMTSTTVSALLILVVLLSSCEETDKSRHQNQKDDRESSK
jgi:hypothetical protein